ncbi:uncharacterized protein LOC132745582 [Ruditapes philippinarum]|uniref:uncharacterized protein LOC132745582 n=1 Tax=Ruditapes philippinarum TaxID=129788 RepID=UPI00295AC47C|nr:uncharacterized protein LOC132745582 [Ruditapes philippinarum]
MNNRFRVVETTRSFAAKISRRNQKSGENVEDYAADLKIIYDKAHGYRDRRTREEDLVRRFLDGLRDEEVRFEIEFHKEPETIDEAVYNVVNFVQTQNSVGSDRRYRAARRAIQKSEDSDIDFGSPSEKFCRVPEKVLPWSRPPTESDRSQSTSSSSRQVQNKQEEILTSILERLDRSEGTGRSAAQQPKRDQLPQSSNSVECYFCHAMGHNARKCPQKRQRLGSYELTHEVVVADIEDDVLLGFDILIGGEKGPADLLLSKGLIIIQGVEIPCQKIGGMKGPRRVTVADDISLPGRAETKAEQIERIVSVLAERKLDDEEENLNRVRRVGPKENSDPGVRANAEEMKIGDVPVHLLGLYEKATKGKSTHEKVRVKNLLCKHNDTFPKDDWDLGVTSLVEHSIETGDAAPVKQRPRRVPLAFAAEEKAAVEDLLKKGVIRKSTSPWASPIVFVRKKSGAVRPCVDYRKVNALVKQDAFPLPRVQDCLDAVAGMSLFSSFDLTSGYFQIPLKKEDIPKTAFTCKYGLFEMTRMPFGLSNSSSTFQRTMELVLKDLQWQTCLVYVDDIIVYSASFDEHMCRVDTVLSRINSAGLKLRPEKCHLLQTEVTFLGHIVSKDGVRPDRTNVAKWRTGLGHQLLNKQYLLGRKFIVRSDRQALVWLFSLKNQVGNRKVDRDTRRVPVFDPVQTWSTSITLRCTIQMRRSKGMHLQRN